MAISAPNEWLTFQNYDGVRVTLTDQPPYHDHTMIILLNGKILAIQREQIWP
jgi:hypothetical protein